MLKWKRIILSLIFIFSVVNISNATYSIKNGETNVTTYFVLRDTSGDPCTALTVTNIDLYYQEHQLAQAAKVDATALAAANSVHADNKAFHCGNGVYRVDWPDAAFDAGIGKPVTLLVTVPTYDVITTYLELVLQPPVNVHTVLEATPFDASADTVDVGKIDGTAQRATDLAEIAQYLFANTSTLTDIIADDSVIAKTLATGGDISEYDEDTDAQQAIATGLSNVANVGSAVNKAASSYELTVGKGTQTVGTYADTAALDGTRHTHTDTAGVLELYYEILVGGGVPSSVTVTGALTGTNDDLEVCAYDWNASGWVQIGVLAGTTSSDNRVESYTLMTTMVGTGADLGKVRVQFTDGAYTLTSSTLYVDQLFVSFSQGSGDYNLGAIWYDSGASNINTVSGVDGISTNPVSTWGAVKTLSSNLNIDKFHIANGSTVTADASCQNYTFIGCGWDLALGGQSFEDAHITGASVSGIATAGSGRMHFVDCTINASDATLGKAMLYNCGIEGDITLSAADIYIFTRCYAADTGGAAPPFLNYNDVASSVGVRSWDGGIKVKNMAAGSKITIQGRGKVSIDSTCDAGGTIGVQGTMSITDNVVGGFSGTIIEDARIDADVITTQTASLLLDTTIDSLVSQTELSLIAGSSIDDSYNQQTVVFYDVSNSDYPSIHILSDYVGLTKSVELSEAPNFTVEASDKVKIFLVPKSIRSYDHRGRPLWYMRSR